MNFFFQVVTDVQVFKKSVPSAMAGDNVGLLMRGIKLDCAHRGMVLAAANSCKPGNRYRAQVYLLSSGEGGRRKPVVSGYIQQMFSTTWNISVRMDLPEGKDMIMPGEHSEVPHFTDIDFRVYIELIGGLESLPNFDSL